MDTTIASAAEAIEQGKITPIELLNQCLEKIEQHEKQVQAWVLVDKGGALDQAQALMEELQKGNYRGPLHGIPIGIKDIFDVADLPTAAGFPLWANSIARADCTAVKKLRQAGAIIVGKTVTTQFASFDPPVTRNPWNLQRTPGGSSSGSAAAVACGMCLGALGSQTGGSITRPAIFCGVSGLKPAYDRVSLIGVVPLSPRMDHAGPIARTVKDLAILMQAIADPSLADDYHCEEDYVHKVDSPPAGLKVGILGGLFHQKAQPVMQNLMKEVEAKMKDADIPFLQLALPASFSEILKHHRIIMAVEAAAVHKERLQRHSEDFLPNIRGLVEEGLQCPAPDFQKAIDLVGEIQNEISDLMIGVDVLLTPATLGPAPGLETTGDPAFNSPWSYLGLPTAAIPAGWDDEGLPLGIQLIGQEWYEAELLQAAAWLEKIVEFDRKDPPIQ